MTLTLFLGDRCLFVDTRVANGHGFVVDRVSPEAPIVVSQ